MTSASLWKRMNGTARLEPASDRGNGGLHGVAEGRLQARRQRHGTTLRRTATAGQAAQPQPHRGWICGGPARTCTWDLILVRHIRGMCSYCKGVR